jgi:sterol desaturase/sphingolipid hydroxylase (fatty acid hydroxylase superfamily)
MPRSFRSRPFVRRCLGNLGPLVVYTVLALVSAWAAWHGGWQSAGGFWGAWFAGFFFVVVCQEHRYCVTGYYRGDQ